MNGYFLPLTCRRCGSEAEPVSEAVIGGGECSAGLPLHELPRRVPHQRAHAAARSDKGAQRSHVVSEHTFDALSCGARSQHIVVEVEARLVGARNLIDAALDGRLDTLLAIDGALSLLAKADGFARGEEL